MYEHPKDVWAPKYNFNVKKLMMYYYVSLIILLHLMKLKVVLINLWAPQNYYSDILYMCYMSSKKFRSL